MGAGRPTLLTRLPTTRGAYGGRCRHTAAGFSALRSRSCCGSSG